MAVSFERTRHALSPRLGLARVAWTTAALVTLLWGYWAFATDVPIYQTSTSARLETVSPALSIESDREGRVTTFNLALGSRVEAGQLLVALDKERQELDLKKAEAEIEGIAQMSSAIEKEVTTLRAATELLRKHGKLSAKVIASKLRQASHEETLATSVSERASELSDTGVMSAAEAERAKIDQAKRIEEVAAMRATLERSRAGSDLEAQELEVRIATLDRDLAQARSQQREAEARADTLRLEIDRREIRAPMSGVVASVSEARVGSLLQAGHTLGSIIPSGEVRLVADFGARALGRIEEGQTARVRFDSLPWLEHGTSQAKVRRVAKELLDGKLRIELEMDDASLGSSLLRHGMTASVDIVVDETTPILWAMRAIGVRRDAK